MPRVMSNWTFHWSVFELSEIFSHRDLQICFKNKSRSNLTWKTTSFWPMGVDGVAQPISMGPPCTFEDITIWIIAARILPFLKVIPLCHIFVWIKVNFTLPSNYCYPYFMISIIFALVPLIFQVFMWVACLFDGFSIIFIMIMYILGV